MLPDSFDPLVLQDQLLHTLQRSPITQQFASLRAEELLQAVIEKPIVNSLKAEIEKLQAELAEEKKLKRTMRSDSKRHTNMTAKESAQKESHINRLNHEVQELTQRLEQVTNNCEQLQQLCDQQEQELAARDEEIEAMKVESIRLQKEAEMLTQRKVELDGELKAKEGQIRTTNDKFVALEKQYEVQIRQMEISYIRKEEELNREVKSKIQLQLKDKLDHDTELKLRQKQIDSLKDERFKLKNEVNGLKIDLNDMKNQYELLKKQEETSQAELLQVREGLKQIKLGFQRERKMLNNRLHELTLVSKAHLKLKNRLKDLSKSFGSIRQQHMRLGRFVSDMLRKLAQENEKAVRSVLDAVGEKVGKEVEQLAAQLKAQAEEVRQAKSEVRSKDDAIERLEKQLSNGSREVSQLKNDAKQHKRQEERLRRELKKTLEQNQAKLTIMQRKYADLYTRVNY